MSSTADLVVDPVEMGRALHLLHPPGDVFEVRVLDARGVRYNGHADQRTATAFGFFDSAESAVESADALKYAQFPGAYVTLNPVTPALLARSVNRLQPALKKSASTSDKDVSRRSWILIDGDPTRPAGISSTDVEHALALDLMRDVRSHLRELSWPEPILADSGNGWHLLYAIDLPGDDDGLVKRVLETLAALFDSERVKIDRTVFNAARITKLYGTRARKGDHTEERPHRMSRLVDVPAAVLPVSQELLEEFVALNAAEQKATPEKKSEPPRPSKAGDFDFKSFMSTFFPDAKREPWEGGGSYVLDPCPFNADHTGTSAACGQKSDGTIWFRCQHNGCAGLEWKDLRAKYAPKKSRATTSTPPPRDEPPAVAYESESDDGAATGEREHADAAAQKDGSSRWTGIYDVAGILGRSGAGGPRFKTGIETLNERMTLRTNPVNVGMPLGRIFGIVGAPGAGKSVTIGQIARSLATQGLRVLILVDDEPREDAAERVGQGLGFRHAELNAEYPKTIERVREAQTGFDLTILPDEEDDFRPTIEDAAALLLSVPNESGHVLAVDSIHSSSSSTEKDGDPPRIGIGKRVRAFRELRRRGVLVLYTAEANRGAYASPDKSKRTAAIAAAAETRELDFGPDAFVFLTRENDVIHVEIPKNRIGRKYEPFSLRLDEGSAALQSLSEETVKAEQDGKHEEYLYGLAGKIVAHIGEAADEARKEGETFNGLTQRAIEDARLGPRADVRDALTRARKNDALKRDTGGPGGGFLFRLPATKGATP